MSNDSGLTFWVGDLDGYVTIDDPFSEENVRQDALEFELDAIGDVPLLAGKATSAWKLNAKGITPLEWRHAVHKAEMAIGSEPTGIIQHGLSGRNGAEGNFVRAMLNLGRAYAVALYARRELLDYHSAITATLPHGIRALVNQFIAAEDITRSAVTDERIRSVLNTSEVGGITAYRRTGMLQAALYTIANEAPGHRGGAAFDRSRTRAILSLTRLHFSTRELRLASAHELRKLVIAYGTDRNSLGMARDRLTSNGKIIHGWRLRHMQSLLDFYPYSIRHGLMRAATSSELSREAIVNELALAHCGVLRMRQAGRNRTRSS